jgi:F0F1-type ATP synthase assembly protein I
VLMGRWADTAWGWAPWGTLTGSLVGILGASLNIYQIVRRLDDDQKRADTRSHDDTPAP